MTLTLTVPTQASDGRCTHPRYNYRTYSNNHIAYSQNNLRNNISPGRNYYTGAGRNYYTGAGRNYYTGAGRNYYTGAGRNYNTGAGFNYRISTAPNYKTATGFCYR